MFLSNLAQILTSCSKIDVNVKSTDTRSIAEYTEAYFFAQGDTFAL